MSTSIVAISTPLHKSTRSHLQKPPKEAPKEIGFKIFIVLSIVLATIMVVTSILALLVTQGTLPTSMGSIKNLTEIREVNSYVMLSGGIALFILGICAWGCHLKKENAISAN